MFLEEEFWPGWFAEDSYDADAVDEGIWGAGLDGEVTLVGEKDRVEDGGWVGVAVV